jgi:uncharacterized protein (TIGR03435 family)
MIVRMLTACHCLGILVAPVFAQPESPKPTFEVASVKVHSGPLTKMVSYEASGPRLSLIAYPITFLVTEAYDRKRYQVVFGPGASEDNTYFDILAIAPAGGNPTRDQFRQMLQTLLTERFNLKVHRDMKDLPVYALVVGKRGPKFKESAQDSVFSGSHGVNGRNLTLKGIHYTMPLLANAINDYFGVDTPVVDRTGLSGFYDLSLEATPEYRLHRQVDGDAPLTEISVAAAIQEQLGLRLEPQKAPVEVVVIDHVGKPSAN